MAQGKIKMPAAQRAILDAHAVAKEIDDPVYEAYCHAVGQAGSTVHTGGHAIGLPMYELTAIVLVHLKNGYQQPVMEKIQFYQERLLYWQERTDQIELEWADFLSTEKE